MKAPQGPLALAKPQELGHRVLGWKRHHPMNMIRLNVQFQHFDFIFLLTALLDVLSLLVGNLILENAKPIFGTKHDMVFALGQRV